MSVLKYKNCIVGILEGYVMVCLRYRGIRNYWIIKLGNWEVENRS